MSAETGKEPKEYEVSYLVASPEHESGVVKIFARHGITLPSGNTSKPVTLAYPVKSHASAYFGFRVFKADPAAIPAVENDLRLDQTILRSLIVKTPKLKPMPAPRVEAKPEAEPAVQIKSPASDTITNEALEQKLEEILRD